MRLLHLLPFLLLALTAAAQPPARVEPVPPFAVPRVGETLDGPWRFVQPVYDADTSFGSWRNYLNAVPVALTFTGSGRGYLALLHTVFRTTDGGRTWRNLDQYPLPGQHSSDFEVLRAPYYISGLAAGPATRDTVAGDSLYISSYNAVRDSGFVRLLSYLGNTHRLAPRNQLAAGSWITGVLLPGSQMGFALAGLDGELFKNQALRHDTLWTEQNPYRVFLRSGRDDSLMPADTWVTAVASTDSFLIAVGSHHWISRDGGQYWRIRGAADERYDQCVSFCDSTHGLTGGGSTTNNLLQGWAHVTHDGAHHWSDRMLDTNLPVRAVLQLSPDVAFAAGGHYPAAEGRIWSSGDGGQTWIEELVIDAEIRALAATRVNGAYVDVFAAGVFPDFSGGIWQTRVFLPDTAGPVVFADPDTLDFAPHAVGERDTLETTLRNTGTQSALISSVAGSGPFQPDWIAGAVELLPGASLPLRIALDTDSAGAYIGSVRITVERQPDFRREHVELHCRAEVGLAADPSPELLPQRLDLNLWPNPTNASVVFRFELPVAGDVRLALYDITGRLAAEVVNARLSAGVHTRSFHTAGLASGIYFARLDGAGQTVTRKLLLLK